MVEVHTYGCRVGRGIKLYAAEPGCASSNSTRGDGMYKTKEEESISSPAPRYAQNE